MLKKLHKIIKNEEVLSIVSSFLLVVAVLAVLSLAVTYSRDFFARLAWQKYENAYMALILVKDDELLALDLGNHYFNVAVPLEEKIIPPVYDIEKAKIAFSVALQSEKPPMWVHHQLGRIYFVEGRLEDALVQFNEELLLYPENIRTKYMLGLTYGYRDHEGDAYLAEENFKMVIEHLPLNWGGYNDLAWILLKEKKYEEAKKVSKEGIAKATDGDKNPWLWNSLGVAELNLEEKDNAFASFEKASEFASTLTLEEWGQAYTGNGPPNQETLAMFREGIIQNIEKSREI